MGDSAGGHLAALIALAADEFSDNRADPNAGTSAQVKAVVSFYGVYDMLAQWHHDQIARPRDQITEKFLGVSPMKDRRVYFDSSPLSYATVDRTRTRFLLVHGTTDDVVDPAQSKDFWSRSTRLEFPCAGSWFRARDISGPLTRSKASRAATAPCRRPGFCDFCKVPCNVALFRRSARLKTTGAGVGQAPALPAPPRPRLFDQYPRRPPGRPC